MIIHNTKEGEYSENKDLMMKIQKTEEIEDLYERYLERVKYCTEDYRAWNYVKDKLDQEKGTVSVIDQLKRTVSAIGFNPKSYESWYHRYYLIKDNKDVKDKDLLNILIKADKRNLHCWNYISKLYSDFSFIPKDVTNYSYLHYSNLNYSHSNYSNSNYSNSFKIFDPLSCIFTDCYDQGMWFYYFTMKERDLLKKPFYVRRYKEEVVIIFRDIFEGEIEINRVVYKINIPTKYYSVQDDDLQSKDLQSYCINKIKVNNKEYILKKEEVSSKYFRDINNLEDNKCTYNMIFNFEIWREEDLKSDMYKKYIENSDNDKYDIYSVCE